MKLHFASQTIKNIIRIFLFIFVVVVLMELFPHQKKFSYQYELGKPWTYELLTAPFDFPIYKGEEQFSEDKKEVMKNFIPYFQKDESVEKRQINKWYSEWKEANNGEEPRFTDYINQKLKLIYKKGILSYKDYEKLENNNWNEIVAVNPNRTTQNVSLDDIYTPKTAYEDVLLNKPYDFTDDEFDKYNINLYLVENLKYDSITSQNVLNNLINDISLTSGMVQKGERIIDKGEIITPEIYSMLNSLKIESDKKSASMFHDSYLVMFGEIIILFVLILLLTLYLNLFRPQIYNSTNNLVFISLLILLIAGISSFVIRGSNLSVFIVPFAILPIIIRVFYDSRTALFVHIITVLIVSFMVSNPFLFIILQVAAGMAAVSGLKDLTQRSQLTQTAFYIFITYSVIYISFEFITEGALRKLHFLPILFFAISSFLLLFTYVLVYVFEKIFGLISALTLVELTNINSDLMLKFAELAPGTFQHSLQMSNLASEAAKKINANSLLVRTGALYHDIGKMKHPEYFIENQIDGENKLLRMNYIEAAQAVIEHVNDGVEIAKKYRLPEQIIGFITTHHGRSKVKYFYNSYVNDNPNLKPDIEKFTYPGPRPFSKETAILMMTDGVEARSRTLEEYTEENITKMVDEMIDSQIADGQFKDAPISFRDVETVKKVLAEKIKSMYHNRIKYPDLNQSEEDEKK